jgi:hypothetical protein
VHRKVTDDDKDDTESLAALSDNNYDSELTACSDSELNAFSDSDCSNPEYEPDYEIVDEDDNDDIGYVFPDVNQCKSALTQHAILNDYGFRIVKKDNEVFRAKCLRAEKGCE